MPPGERSRICCAVETIMAIYIQVGIFTLWLASVVGIVLAFLRGDGLDK